MVNRYVFRATPYSQVDSAGGYVPWNDYLSLANSNSKLVLENKALNATILQLQAQIAHLHTIGVASTRQ